MFLLIFVLFSLILATEGSETCDSSEKSWSVLKPEITNCFEINDGRLTDLFSDPLSTAVKDCPFASGDTAGYNRPEYVKQLSCRCAKEAREQSYSWFGIGRKGECFVCYTSIISLEYLLPTGTEKDVKDERLKHRKNCYVYEGPDITPIEERVIKPDDILVGGVGSLSMYELFTETDVDDSDMYTGGLSCASPIDLGFLVDVSGSVGKENFHKLVEWLKNFIRLMYTDDIRVCFLEYDHFVYPELYFEDTKGVQLQELLKKVSKISYPGGATLTQNALEKSLHACFAEKHWRNDDGKKVSQFLMTFSDGRTWGGSDTLIDPSNKLKELGVEMFAVGIGDANRNELQKITDRVFMFDSFKTFLSGFRERMEEISTQICDVADDYDYDYD